MSRYTHNKTGGVYQVIGTATMQTSKPIEDNTPLTVYASEHDGSMWVRPTEEFKDGRFTPVGAETPEDEHLYRTRPVVKSAYQFNASDIFPDSNDWPAWIKDAANKSPDEPGALFLDAVSLHLYIVTLEGVMRVMPGDWIIRGVAGELYPCKPDIFAKTYEEVL